jgi:hypothetical protein
MLALQRIKKGRKLVVLLHKLDTWNTVLMLHTLTKFMLLQLFKPKKKHPVRSSFYVVAYQMQLQSPCFRAAVANWKGNGTKRHLEVKLGTRNIEVNLVAL